MNHVIFVMSKLRNDTERRKCQEKLHKSHSRKGIVDKIHMEIGDTFISLKKLGSSFGFVLYINGPMSSSYENSLKQTNIFVGNNTDLDNSEK